MNFRKISEIFSLYNLGDIKDKPEIIKGDIDINYKINAKENSYLLKYIVNKSNLLQFEFLGNLHEYLRQKEILVPKIYRSKNNNYIEQSYILYEFINGEIKKDWSDNEIVSLVINFAKMLKVLKDYPVPDFVKKKDDKYIRGGNIAYCHKIFRPKILEFDQTEIKDLIIDTIDLLYEKLPDFEQLPKSLIHGDLNESNAIFKNSKNIAIIDFGLSYDPIVYDLGEFCYWFAFPWWTQEFNHQHYSLILETFNKIMLLSTTEKELLPYMLLRRSMMDIMLTLQYFWTNKTKVKLPEKRLKEQLKRNQTIIKNLILHK